MASTPQELRFIPHSSPTSPLAHKRQRLDSMQALQSSVETNTLLNIADSRSALLELDADSHQIAKEQEDKETNLGSSCARHVRHYEEYWLTTFYAAGDPAAGRAAIPAHPITTAKAVIFLQYESTRPQINRKRKAADMDEAAPESSSVGVSGLKQAISALEHHRLHNQHLYTDTPEARITLRSDPRTKAFESTAAHREPQRVKMSHSIKAKGSSADTYTFEELVKCSVSCLTGSYGPNSIFVDVRDRVMLLTSTSVAFRGDSSRALLWSDQFLSQVPILAKGLDAKIPALTLIPRIGFFGGIAWRVFCQEYVLRDLRQPGHAVSMSPQSTLPSPMRLCCQSCRIRTDYATAE
ncbi:hypothetical protein K438DRAFT_1978281 [Mycena galopus ATCC 62051]|nr:hypothetical protein K438DRAFT_1978281 [Mycena galopus ATCC 62051]